MKKVSLIILVLMLTGCAYQHAFWQENRSDPLRHNPRILFRDLTKPYHAVQASQHYGIIATRYADKQHHIVTKIQFANDSIIPLDQMLFIGLIKHYLTDTGAKVILVGHSHGKTAVGNSTLAVRRVKAVAALLEKAGISQSRIVKVAAWSHQAKGNMSKLVVAYIVPANWNNVTLQV